MFILIYNFIPGFSILSFFKKKFSTIGVIIYSILLSFVINILAVYIFKYLHFEITPLVSLSYLLAFSVLFFVRFKKIDFIKLKKFEKYVILLYIFYFIIFSSFLLFGYTSNDYGDYVEHINNLKGAVEDKGLPDYHHYFFIQAENAYPKGFTSIHLMPFILFNETNGLIIIQTLLLFSRIIPILFAMLIFLAATLFIKFDKVGFYSNFLFLFAGVNVLLPIYWGGLATNFSRLFAFATFILLWQIFLNKGKQNKQKNRDRGILVIIFMAALFTATAFSIRPDVVVHYPIVLLAILFSILLFYPKYKIRMAKILVFYGLLSLIFCFLLYFPSVVNYYNAFSQSSLMTYYPTLLNFLNFRMLVPALFFACIALFSFKEKKAYPLIALGLSYAILVPILVASRIFFVSYHIAFTLTIPLSVVAGITLTKSKFLLNKKLLRYAFFIALIILFILINIRQHYITDMALQEKELDPLLWIKENLNEDARIFYLLYKRPVLSKEYTVDIYGAKGIGQWISPISERTALSMFSAYSFDVEKVHLEFSNISLKIQEGTISTNELETFFDKYRFTHIMLTYEEYNSYPSYFGNYRKLYEDAGYVVLKRP